MYRHQLQLWDGPFDLSRGEVTFGLDKVGIDGSPICVSNADICHTRECLSTGIREHMYLDVLKIFRESGH